MVGTPYTNNPISLSEEELHKLPTIILQFKGDTVSNTDFDMLSTKNVPLARDLDPENPYDVILAVPPSHYYEYQPSLGMYIPGLYFDEPDGSVLGANVMMLHNIFFDVEHYRIGWAESFCDYTKLVSPFVEKKTTTTDVLPGEPYKGQKLRVHRPFHNDNERPLTTHVSAFAKVGLSSRVRPSFCSSATCQIGSAIGVLLVILATVVIVFALKTKLTRAREVRQRSNFRKPPAANHSTLKLRSPTESESDVSIHVRGKDFTKGVILRSRSTQIIV